MRVRSTLGKVRGTLGGKVEETFAEFRETLTNMVSDNKSSKKMLAAILDKKY